MMIDADKDARNENIQIVRFAAAALVLIAHSTFYIHERVDKAFAIWHAGESGVPIFFVVSGFVLYLSSRKLPANADGAKSFIYGRIARVIPLYWLITTLKIGVALAVPAVVAHNHPDVLTALASYSLFPMFDSAGKVEPLHGVAWTLLHEMFFYYVLSISLVLRQPPFICCSMIIGVLVIIGWFVPGETAIAHVYLNEVNLLFVAGMALAILHVKGFRLPGGIALLMVVLGIASFIIPELRALRQSFFGSLDIGAIFIVSGLLSMQFSVLAGLRRGLARLGDSSYSLYMIHPLLAPALCLALSRYLGHSFYLCLAMVFICTVGAAHLVYQYIERPLNGKARRLLGGDVPQAAYAA